MKNISSVSKWPFQHTKMAILRKWGYVLKWPFWGNGGMVANSANSGAFYTILTNIWHPWRSWVRLHMEVQLELWEKFESNLLVWTLWIKVEVKNMGPKISVVKLYLNFDSRPEIQILNWLYLRFLALKVEFEQKLNQGF